MHTESPKKEIIISFDRGTLLLFNLSFLCKEQLDQIKIPMVWDDIFAAYRIEAFYYRFLLIYLTQEKISYVNRVFAKNQEIDLRQPELRLYQNTAQKSWLKSGKKGIICLPTGAGKTRLAMYIIARLKVSTLVLVPTRVLLEQWHLNLSSLSNASIGRIGDGVVNLQPITITTFASAFRRMDSLGNCFKFLVIDEVHHFGGGKFDDSLLMSAAPYRLGLTATKPKDIDQLSKLMNLVGDVVHEQNIEELSGTFLAPYRHEKLNIALSISEKVRYDAEVEAFQKYFRSFKNTNPNANWQNFVMFCQQSKEGRTALLNFYRSRRIVSYAKEKRNILSMLLEKHLAQKVLIFTSDAATAIKISKDFLIPCIMGSLSKKERALVLEHFSTGVYSKLVSCKVLNEGVDVPDAEIAIILGGSSESREQIQRIGRILRPQLGKQGIVYEVITKDTFEVRYSLQRNE